jgi:predicted MPP superfamily phosphohydrolase
MHADKGQEFIESLDPTGVDVLVLAGDITSIYSGRKNIKNVLTAFSDKYPHTVFVMGNHEHYGGVPEKTRAIIHEIADDVGRIDVLDNSSVVINDQRFIGGTGWFPYYAHNDKFKQFMNDFRIIIGFEEWVYEQHKALDILLNGELLESDIVVTHHLPSIQCIAPQYKLSPLNGFFLSEFDDLILEKKPKLWLNGHTHHKYDFKIGPTRIVCNPLGYPSEIKEQNAFQDKLLIEV